MNRFLSLWLAKIKELRETREGELRRGGPAVPDYAAYREAVGYLAALSAATEAAADVEKQMNEGD